MPSFRYPTGLNQSGLTLIELLIAMTLSVFLLTIVTNIYWMAHKSLQTQWAMSERQSNVRIATELLAKNIRMAGHVGCGRLSDGLSVTGYSTFLLNEENKITDEGISSMKKETDAITLRYMSDKTVKLQREMESESELVVGKEVAFLDGDILMIANCEAAEIFQVENVQIVGDMQHIQVKQPLSRKFTGYPEVGKLVVNTFFIGKTGRKYPDKENIDALYSADITRRKIELVEGVQDMKIQHLKGKDGEHRGVQLELLFYTRGAVPEKQIIFVALR